MPSISLPAALAVGGAASLGGSLLSSNAAKSAANTQAQSANQAEQLQQQMFQQAQQTLAPYVGAGNTATNQLLSLLGLGPSASPGFTGTTTTSVNGRPVTVGGTAPGNPVSGTEWINTAGGAPQLDVWDQSSGRWGIPNSSQVGGYLGGQTAGQVATSAINGLNGTAGTNPLQTALAQTPGYQFALDQGLQSIINQATATGGVGGGNTLKALMSYGTGLASQTYQNQVQNAYNLANLGENAAAGQGALSANTGNSLANLITGAGSAKAAGQVGSANAIGAGIGGLTNNFLLASLLSNPGTSALGAGGFVSADPLGAYLGPA